MVSEAKHESAKCQYGHDHESWWAAQRCTVKTRERDVRSIILAHQVQKALVAAAPLTGDPFKGF